MFGMLLGLTPLNLLKCLDCAIYRCIAHVGCFVCNKQFRLLPICMRALFYIKVVAELERNLETEKPRMNVDLRRTLAGGNKGKNIDWSVSEVRTLELLEGLCPGMKNYGVAHQAMQCTPTSLFFFDEIVESVLPPS